ncbi:MAG TPA: beta-N-acetylhexosaminidase [Bacteroidetes bacterium]|nr:beta-N-acetylhexosaminidase [Bacteroidota bacterium]
MIRTLFRMFSVLVCLVPPPAGAQSEEAVKSRRTSIAVVPKPVETYLGPGSFILSAGTTIVYSLTDADQKSAAEFLVERLRVATGFTLPVQDAAQTPGKNFILFSAVEDGDLGKEGYRVEVRRDAIRLEATGSGGFFYSVQTLLQLLPAEAYSGKPVKGVKWTVPCLKMTDYPRFQWRGMHLDVSRHFMPKEFIKTYIDMLAMHKMNVFHWHLTDDQGWRVESKKFPKLTEVAAWRVDREERHWNDREPQKEGEKATYGGFYTQEEIKEIVKYAARRNITIVPEIEMPAHATALLAAYPHFSCTGGPFKVPPGGVWPITDIFCAGNDSTFSFLQEILAEVMDLFPGAYLHIGGDEADKKEWKVCPKCQARIKQEGLKDEAELQSYFVKRIERFIVSKGRRLIGWDEILEGGLAPEATVMSWRGPEGGIAAARQGHDAVMSPVSHCYFDFYQGNPEYEPLAIGGYAPLSKVYSYEPVPEELTSEEAKHVLGAQGNVWTEYIPTPEHAQYMTLPRMAALAEVVWSKKELRNWSDFVPRVEQLTQRYQSAGYKYAKSAYLVSISTAFDSTSKKMNVVLGTEMNYPSIHYTLDGRKPTQSSRRYGKPLVLRRTFTVRAGAFWRGRLLNQITETKIYSHKALFKPVKLTHPYRRYDGGGEHALTDGMRGTESLHGMHWQGFHQDDLEAVVDLGTLTRISKLTASFLEKTDSWIFFPTHVEFAVSDDGSSYVSVGSFEIQPTPGQQPPRVKQISQKLSKVRARYVKLTAKNIGVAPAWHTGKGDKAWLFVDEIMVE